MTSKYTVIFTITKQEPQILLFTLFTVISACR